LNVTQQFNNTILDTDYKIKISGIGLNVDEGIYLDNDGKFYGEAVNVAFKLAEDIAEGGEIIMTNQAYSQVSHFEKLNHVTTEDGKLEDFEGLQYKRLKGSIEYKESFIGFDQVPESSPARIFVERFKCYQQCQAIDAKINKKLLQAQTTVVMYGVEWEKVEKQHGIEGFLGYQNRYLDLLVETFKKFGGEKKTSLIFIFSNAANAVKACLEAKKQVTTTLTDIPFKGFGLHIGPMIVVKGTELLLGDCINTASKLSEDLGAHGSVNVSDTLFELIKNDEELKKHNVEQKEQSLSGVAFKYASYH